MSKEQLEVPESVSTLVMIFAFFAGIYGVFDQYGHKIKYFLFCVFIFLIKLALVILAGWGICMFVMFLWEKLWKSKRDFELMIATAEETSNQLGNFKVKMTEEMKELSHNCRQLNYTTEQLRKQVVGLRNWTGLALKEEQDRLEEEARQKLEQALNEANA